MKLVKLSVTQVISTCFVLARYRCMKRIYLFESVMECGEKIAIEHWTTLTTLNNQLSSVLIWYEKKEIEPISNTDLMTKYSYAMNASNTAFESCFLLLLDILLFACTWCYTIIQESMWTKNQYVYSIFAGYNTQELLLLQAIQMMMIEYKWMKTNETFSLNSELIIIYINTYNCECQWLWMKGLLSSIWLMSIQHICFLWN